MSLTSYRAAPPRANDESRLLAALGPHREGDEVNGFVLDIRALRRPQSLATTYSSIA